MITYTILAATLAIIISLFSIYVLRAGRIERGLRFEIIDLRKKIHELIDREYNK